jgi:hypothetical protein
MAHEYRATILTAAYLMFGVAWIPTEGSLALPSVLKVMFKECRTSCVKMPDGRTKCTRTCSTQNPKSGPTNAINAPAPGSTGPSVPPKPVGTQK